MIVEYSSIALLTAARRQSKAWFFGPKIMPIAALLNMQVEKEYQVYL